jgi:hypothetical protein
VATVVEVNYLFRFGLTLFRGPGMGEVTKPHSGLDLTTVSLMAAALLTATILIAPLGDQLGEIAGQASDRGLYIMSVFRPEGVNP